MTEDLEEIRQRQEQLERYVNLLETRVDLQESLMRLYTARREPQALPAEGARRPASRIRSSEDSISCFARS